MRLRLRPLGEPWRSLLTTIVAGGCYGFAIGASKNLTYALRSTVKLPLLLLGTVALCVSLQFVLARFLGVPLRLHAVLGSAGTLTRTFAVLLASLAPVSLFLAHTMVPPRGDDLGGYPGFVLTNMLFIALAGSVAVARQARALLREHAIPTHRSLLLVGSWLSVSLLVGGQLAFWLRPFFGIASLPSGGPFVLGDEPTSTGARNFYEAVWQFVAGAY
ncbi:MAG: hypothetical protein WAT39_08865 [Planctomycetota bacterium]